MRWVQKIMVKISLLVLLSTAVTKEVAACTNPNGDVIVLVLPVSGADRVPLNTKIRYIYDYKNIYTNDYLFDYQDGIIKVTSLHEAESEETVVLVEEQWDLGLSFVPTQPLKPNTKYIIPELEGYEFTTGDAEDSFEGQFEGLKNVYISEYAEEKYSYCEGSPGSCESSLWTGWNYKIRAELEVDALLHPDLGTMAFVYHVLSVKGDKEELMQSVFLESEADLIIFDTNPSVENCYRLQAEDMYGNIFDNSSIICEPKDLQIIERMEVPDQSKWFCDPDTGGWTEKESNPLDSVDASSNDNGEQDGDTSTGCSLTLSGGHQSGFTLPLLLLLLAGFWTCRRRVVA